MHHSDGTRWLRWLVLDHLLLIVLILMVATVFSVLFIEPSGVFQEPGLQRSMSE